MPPEHHVESAETLPIETASARSETLPPEVDTASEPRSAPIHDWDRYELFELIGKGGMGVVYRARDRRLDRSLAIKFLLVADPTLTLRLLREARAQARIDHPNVCRVYEVGEIAGRAYIALQLIAGEPLHHAAPRMSLDHKVAVMRTVALAIHEAHRLGIVHRDLKPANIMVEPTADGRWIPVVMDFGLARELTVEAGLTESGALLGTPAYMSPEQARGEVRAIDRRSDIYSLGATLYELLVGQPPFSNPALAEILTQVIHDEPPAPRSLVPSLPLDLETIALKCLAKEPAQRYASARALADDLGRYRDGESILGRRASRRVRLRRWGRRHRALVILGACSLAIICALGVFGVRSWLGSRQERARTRESAQLAERLGREASEIEGDLREAYQWPLHDTRDDRKRVRARMSAIAVTHHDLGELGDAAVHDALGRGHLALHEWPEAADELRLAEKSGRQTPELHAALGRALGELYHRAYEAARRSGDQAWIAARQKELAQQFLQPALTELAQSRATENAALLEALIALYRGDAATAEQRALAVAEHAPGSSEARKLAGDAAYAAALEALDHGAYDAARPGFERATTRYAEASEIARSDASLYEAAAQAWLQLAELDVRQRKTPLHALESALSIIDDRALCADPDNAAIYTLKSYVLLRWFRTPALASAPEQQQPLLERTDEAAARAVKLDPRSARAWDALGYTHYFRGRFEAAQGRDGNPWWRRAIDEIDHALTIQPDDPQALGDLGAAHRRLATSLGWADQDPMPEYQAALRSFARAAALDPQYLSACTNQVDLHNAIAEYQDATGDDPRPAVASALQVGARCLTIDANYYLTYDNLAQAQLTLAHYLAETEGDPTAALASARDDLDRVAALELDSALVWYHRLVAANVEARFQLRRRADASPAIALGHAALQKVLAHNANNAEYYVEAARLALAEAAVPKRAASESKALLTQALAHAQRAIAIDPQLPTAELAAAESCLGLATAQPTKAVIDRGLAYADQALHHNAHLVEAQAVRVQLLWLR
jgi:serine/threonine-protein kinase